MKVATLDRPPIQDNLTESDAQTRAALLSKLSYEVALVLSDDPKTETFESSTTVVFDAAHEGSETFINITAHSIDECTLNGRRLTEVQHVFNGNTLRLPGLCAGSNQLMVVAQCEYSSSIALNTGRAIQCVVEGKHWTMPVLCGVALPARTTPKHHPMQRKRVHRHAREHRSAMKVSGEVCPRGWDCATRDPP